MIGTIDLINEDSDGIIVTMNPECSKFWESGKDSTGKKLSELGIPPELYKDWFRIFRKGDTLKTKEYSITKNGV